MHIDIDSSRMNPVPDLHTIHLKQIMFEETVLEPSFESTSKIFYHLLSTHIFSSSRRASFYKNQVHMTAINLSKVSTRTILSNSYEEILVCKKKDSLFQPSYQRWYTLWLLLLVPSTLMEIV